ncbi:MAG: UDP-N-acetylglucosamine 1-carboxyvinyltransferase [Synergistaceae bacterium]|jgi:UDP-N-acetylglucosamine 1-carboxyvinyltransferase|nr:UDP-N-acetylglucosamine 1-carboxyvinyltransferase [Synergistaceae bacterium]
MLLISDRMLIRGGRPLTGRVRTQGAKNAALPVMAAALLLKGRRLRLSRVPDLQDIHTMADLLRHLGAEIEFKGGTMTIDVPEELKWETPSDLVRKMRASSLVLGPLVARCGKAVLPLPGGCAIGSRPIDFHLRALTRMGAEIDLEQGSVHARTDGLSATRINFDFPSVGATENILMTAALTEGETTIENAAREPEIVNLAESLRAMGAAIEGDGTGTILVRGKKYLDSAEVTIIPDRIEASTYLLAGVITRGHVRVDGIDPEYLEALTAKLEEAGAPVTASSDSVEVDCRGLNWNGVTLKTLPYPGFPTDVQPQIMAALCLADGTSVIHESVFDSRYMHVGEFRRMGCKIDIQGNTVVIAGVPKVSGAEVHASDLRAGAALILLGLAAEGETVVCSLKHVWRGYENLMGKLRSLGADIELLPDGESGDKFDGAGD